jgi:hypothetical protein
MFYNRPVTVSVLHFKLTGRSQSNSSYGWSLRWRHKNRKMNLSKNRQGTTAATMLRMSIGQQCDLNLYTAIKSILTIHRRGKDSPSERNERKMINRARRLEARLSLLFPFSPFLISSHRDMPLRTVRIRLSMPLQVRCLHSTQSVEMSLSSGMRETIW